MYIAWFNNNQIEHLKMVFYFSIEYFPGTEHNVGHESRDLFYRRRDRGQIVYVSFRLDPVVSMCNTRNTMFSENLSAPSSIAKNGPHVYLTCVQPLSFV